MIGSHRAGAGGVATPRLVATALACGLPLAFFIATASANGYWLDSGEFVAASVTLGISHPPGHPLAALVGALALFVPLGPIPLRVALASAVLAAAAALFLFRAIETTVRALGLEREGAVLPLAVAGTWLVALSSGFWFQAVRPEVYALNAALACFVLERFVHLEGRAPVYDLRPLYAAMLALGFALSNHHFLAFLLLPALAPTLARARVGRGARPLVLSALAVAVGLLTYLYLPLRAAQDPSLNLGDPTTFKRFFWVVSAEAFQKSAAGEVAEPLWERFADVAVHLVTDLHFAGVLLAVGGLYVMMRLPAGRRVGFLWVVVIAVHVAARAWLGFVRSNPDALGYLMPAFGAVGALATAFVAAVILGLERGRRPGRLLTFLAFAAAGASLLQIPRTLGRASLADFHATDAIDSALRRDLPPRAVVMAHGPGTVFRFWGGEASEQIRPDVELIPMPFVDHYPGLADRLAARDPSLRSVLRGYLLSGELRQPDLQSLAAERPLLVEMDPRVPPALYETLVPRGLYHEVLADGATDTDERLGAEDQREVLTAIHEAVGGIPSDPETRSFLLFRHYVNALYYAGFGDRAAARESAAAALELDPHARELLSLRRALEPGAGGEEGPGEDKGPLDVRPFMPGAAGN